MMHAAALLTSPPEADHTLRPEDAKAIRELVRRSGVFTEIEIGIAGELADAVLSGSDTSYRFIFFRDTAGIPVAYSCYGEIPLTDKRYDLYWIVVDPLYQGKGLARQILEHTRQQVMRLGGVHLYAETSGTAAYAPAREFYLKNGFTQIAELPDFYRDGDNKIIFQLIPR